jgi:heavy metal sensor kinase
MIKSLRIQLTAWYLLFFTLLLILFSVFFYEVLSRALYQRLDQTLSSEAGTAAGLFRSEMTELNGDAPGAARETVAEVDSRNRLLAIFDSDQPLAAGAPVDAPELRRTVVQARQGEKAEVLTTVPSYGKAGSRAVTERFMFNGRTFIVLMVESLDSVVDELAMVRRVLYLSLPLVLLIAGIGGFLLAARSIAPLRWMADQARNITDKNLDSRLDIGDARQELRTLADSFNELLSRLDQSFETMRRFVADASHELRTPISVIRGEADVALAQDRTAGEYQESLAIIQDEARRLSRLVDDLLNLARADAGHLNLRVEEFYLNDLLGECCRAVESVARDKNVLLHCECAEDINFRGDQELIRRLVLNLLDNAIRYTSAGGEVSVKLEADGSDLRIHVSDTGVGIAPETVPHVFERFYRGDQARSRQNGGFGLGLSIVKWIAESHRGSVQLSSKPGKGTKFTVLLHR